MQQSSSAAAVRGWPPPSSAPILVVEDTPTIRRLLVALLADVGRPVLLASNGAEALERVRQQPPCLILLDLNMQVMDGRAFLAAYREGPGPHAPVIACTATNLQSEALAAQLAVVECVVKPFDLDDLLLAVRRHAPVTTRDALGTRAG